jgi:hypothetical protein
MKAFLKLSPLIIALTIFISSSFASLNFPPYNNSLPPKIELSAAYGSALRILGAATNQFHCVGHL